MEFLFVDGGLRGELCEIDAGAEVDGVEIDFERIEDALVRIEGVVARIASEICGEARE